MNVIADKKLPDNKRLVVLELDDDEQVIAVVPKQAYLIPQLQSTLLGSALLRLRHVAMPITEAIR